MPVFEYEVADRSGAMSRGRAEAQDQGDLIARFREQGRLVLSVRPADGRASGIAGDGGGVGAVLDGVREIIKRISSGVGIGVLVLFTGQLAAMLAGGLHLVRILTSLASETTNKNFKKVLEDTRDDITAGASFADALGQHPHVFDRLYVAVVRAGEISGSLPVVLDTLTTHLEKAA